MKFVWFILPPGLALLLASCKPLAPEVVSQDCTVPAVPANFTRIYIGATARGRQQSGTSSDDPLDGATAQKFDTILRTIAEGQHPTWGTQQNIGPENLIVCIANGTFQTDGQFDFAIDTPGSQRGFTVEKNWKIHGHGPARTTLQLASFVRDTFTDTGGVSFPGGRNIVIGTHSDGASGVEISDLTVDGNHDRLTSPGGPPLDLAGIMLRSFAGGHWIHDVNLIGGSGDAGMRNITYETFALQVWGSSAGPQASVGNLIENVTVASAGRPMSSDAAPGGAMDGVVVNNASAEVRHNVIDGIEIGFGGWSMGHVSFHDNTTRNTDYGFNADSFSNNNITLQSNQFIHPREYGIIMGGGNPAYTFANWIVASNVITLNNSNSTAIGLQGQVQNSIFVGNTIQSDSANSSTMVGLTSFSTKPQVTNFNNVFQDNVIDKSLIVNFLRDQDFNTDCRHQNRDLQGNPRPDFPDNTSANCP